MPPKRKAATKEAAQETSNEEVDYASLRVVDLQKLLKKKGLETKGLKADLIKRLQASNDQQDDENVDDEMEVDKVEEKPTTKKTNTKKQKEEVEEEDEDEEDSSPTKRAKTTKKEEPKNVPTVKSTKKTDSGKGKEEEEEDDADNDDSAEGENETENLIQRILARKVTKTKVSGSFGLVWSELDTMMVLDSPEIRGSNKIIGFDMDSTLIEPKSGAKFPKSRSDWQWLIPDVIVKKLKEIHEEGYKIVIFTNQAGIEKNKQKPGDIQGKILDLAKELGFPIQAFVAAATDVFRKPNTTMWDYMVAHHNGGVAPDMSKCLYVGDAAGRAKGWSVGKKKDFSCGDRTFAHNVGVSFKTPEEFFLNEKPVAFEWDSVDPQKILDKLSKAPLFDEKTLNITGRQEMVVLVGCPASGKSTLAKRYFVKKGYVHVNRDTLKTMPKCVQVCQAAFDEGKSVVVDNTNPSADARSDFLSVAKSAGIPARCFVLNTDVELAHHLNFFREKLVGVRRVPDVAYNQFKSKFREPTTKEGFEEVTKIAFYPKFDHDDHKRLFLQRT